jgi:hypothetical protein
VSTEAGEIIFRSWGELVPRDCLANHNWQVEYYEGLGVPLGIAWVLAQPGFRESRRRPIPPRSGPGIECFLRETGDDAITAQQLPEPLPERMHG